MTDPKPNQLPAGPKERIEQLIELLTRECGELTEPEKKLARAVVLGEWCDLGVGDHELLSLASQGYCWKDWGPHRTIRARMIRALCLSRDAQEQIDSAGLRLMNARVSGTLDLAGSHIPFDLWLVHCGLDRDLLAQDARMHCLGLPGSHVPRLLGDRLATRSGLFLRSGFCSYGGVYLPGAHVGDDFDCSGGRFLSDDDRVFALAADNLRTSGNVLLTDSFLAVGEVRLNAATIGGSLDCGRSRFQNKGGIAFAAQGATIGGALNLGPRTHVVGEVRLIGTVIGNSLNCGEAHIENEAGLALVGDGLKASGIQLRHGFTSHGEVKLQNATVSGSFECSNARLTHPNGDALNLSGTTMDTFLFREVATKGTVDLTRTRIGYLHDSAQRPTWPESIVLADCRYDAIHLGSCLDARGRLEWLANHDKTLERFLGQGIPPDPGPYKWLAGVLRKQGRERDATEVMICLGWRRAFAKYRQRQKKSKTLALLRGIPEFMYGAVVGHGYAHFRPLWWLIGMWVLGTILFSVPAGPTMQPTQGIALREWSQNSVTPSRKPLPPWQWSDANGFVAWFLGHPTGGWLGDYPKFHPVVYSLDAFLPLVDFHQEEYWTPIDGPILSWRWIVKNVYLPIHIAMGWIVATLFAASFTKLARHE